MVPTTITYHPFPSARDLCIAGVEENLRELSFGYRARYIAETAKMLVSKTDHAPQENQDEKNDERRYESVDQYLLSLRKMTYPQARQELLQFPGVGPKVAE